MRFQPQISFEPITNQNAYQFLALKNQLKYVLERSPFYKQFFKAHKININNINSLSDLNFLPTTSKTDIQEHNWDFLCVNDKKIKEYVATIGAKGQPVNIALTENDIKRLIYNEYQSLLCVDGKPTDIYQLMLPLHRQLMAGMYLYMGLRKLGATLVRTGPGALSMQYDTIKRLQPNNLIAVPTLIKALFDWAKEQNIDLTKTSIQKIICIGENIRTSDFELNTLGEYISNNGQLKLYSTYASTEMQTSFIECGAGKGCHLLPDLIILEILNERGNPLQQGEYGEVVITTLGVEGMPLIRFKTGDICAYYDTVCSCGRTTRRLSPVIGRKQQMIKFKGATLYPNAIFDVLETISFIKDYIVEVYTNELGLDGIRLHLQSTLSKETSELKLRPLLKSKFQEIPILVFHTIESLQTIGLSNKSENGEKFIDNRENKLFY